MVTVSLGNFPAAQILHLVMSQVELTAFDTLVGTLKSIAWTQNGFSYRLVQGFSFLLEIEVVG